MKIFEETYPRLAEALQFDSQAALAVAEGRGFEDVSVEGGSTSEAQRCFATWLLFSALPNSFEVLEPSLDAFFEHLPEEVQPSTTNAGTLAGVFLMAVTGMPERCGERIMRRSCTNLRRKYEEWGMPALALRTPAMAAAVGQELAQQGISQLWQAMTPAERVDEAQRLVEEYLPSLVEVCQPAFDAIFAAPQLEELHHQMQPRTLAGLVVCRLTGVKASTTAQHFPLLFKTHNWQQIEEAETQYQWLAACIQYSEAAGDLLAAVRRSNGLAVDVCEWRKPADLVRVVLRQLGSLYPALAGAEARAPAKLSSTRKLNGATVGGGVLVKVAGDEQKVAAVAVGLSESYRGRGVKAALENPDLAWLFSDLQFSAEARDAVAAERAKQPSGSR